MQGHNDNLNIGLNISNINNKDIFFTQNGDSANLACTGHSNVWDNCWIVSPD